MQKEIQNYIGEFSLDYTNAAIFGKIQLQVHKYLILIVNSQCIGQLLGHEIYLIKQLVFYPLSESEVIHKNDQIYIEMIKSILCDDSCYYSLTYNLTHSLQFKKNRNRFAINHKYLEEIENKTYVINGCVQIYNNATLTYCQIVRRECLRQGRRFTQRGCDQQGNCTNYTEIEDVYQINKSTYSFIQVRGSLPFKWSQLPYLNPKPNIQIDSNSDNNIELCNAHLFTQIQYYREMFILNLIDRKGKQQKLGNYFQSILESFQRREIQYFWFDFHQERANLNKLVDEISSVLEQYGYYQIANQNTKLISEQKGVFRVNCMSCIDRTNVVQYLISKFILEEIIQDAGLEDSLEFIHKKVWINSGNQLSKLYSGTNSLKNNYIRYGKQTKYGMIQDAVLSTKRYFLNHFNDYHIQNSIDLTLGLWDMNDSRFHNYKFENSLQKCILIFILLMIMFNYLNLGILSPALSLVVLNYFPQIYQVRSILTQ
ncbi:unnamed protein product [Paramecium pentaurelia]|uniref:SAC domain-containing protein n=1 Tax=Paramecium pentaurelia TaxID=43138 RepID=A0A8S1UEV1_9CILI|nr:unnamed protein product [Paramecium pentaurelia]